MPGGRCSPGLTPSELSPFPWPIVFWMGFLERRRAKRVQAITDDGNALFEWALAISRGGSREKAIELFVAKVRREKVSKGAVQFAFGRTVGKHLEAFAVLYQGIGRLTETLEARD